MRIVTPEAARVCSLTPEQVEGPYYLDDAKLRSDIREGKPGVPLRVALRLVDVRSCRPLEGAAVDLWHCDGEGRYSGFVAESIRMPRMPPPGSGPRPPGFGPPAPGFGPPGGPPVAHRSDASTFLRGVQLSDASGAVQFTTVYPGWYPGRAVHIHLRVRTEGSLQSAGYGGHVAHTGQLYLPESVSDQVFRLAPYGSHDGARMRQTDDRIFAAGGSAGLVELSSDSNVVTNGYVAAATVVLDPTETPVLRK